MVVMVHGRDLFSKLLLSNPSLSSLISVTWFRAISLTTVVSDDQFEYMA